jgi:hypothetical protein
LIGAPTRQTRDGKGGGYAGYDNDKFDKTGGLVSFNAKGGYDNNKSTWGGRGFEVSDCGGDSSMTEAAAAPRSCLADTAAALPAYPSR